MDRGELYDAIWDEVAYREFPSAIANIIGGRSCTLYQFGGSIGLTNLHHSYFPFDLSDRLATAECETADLWGNAGVASGIVGKAVVMDDLVPEQAFRSSYLWNEVIRPMGDDTGHCLGMVHKLDGAVLCTAVQRSISAGRFTREEASLLDAIATDLHRIYLARNLMVKHEAQGQSLSDLLQAGREGLILIDHMLRVIEITPEAEEIIAQSNSAEIRHRFLHIADRSMQAELRTAVENTIHRRPVLRSSFTCSPSTGSPPLRLLVLPAQQNGGSGCAIHVSGSGRQTKRAEIWLLDHYGLTKTEVVVAQALSAGQSPHEICVNRQVSLHTVRAQIRQILEKTGSDSIPKFMALMHGVA
jgi:DNA-binding CsgD family transcriptional regulator